MTYSSYEHTSTNRPLQKPPFPYRDHQLWGLALLPLLPQHANQLRRRRPRPGDKWHMDEAFLTIHDERHYLWRAVDQAGNALDILVQRRRDKQAATSIRAVPLPCRSVPRPSQPSWRWPMAIRSPATSTRPHCSHFPRVGKVSGRRRSASLPGRFKFSPHVTDTVSQLTEWCSPGRPQEDEASPCGYATTVPPFWKYMPAGNMRSCEHAQTCFLVPYDLPHRGEYAGCQHGVRSLGVPDPASIDYPAGESPLAAEVNLGKVLFFDPRLSSNENVSCASCHNPSSVSATARRAA